MIRYIVECTRGLLPNSSSERSFVSDTKKLLASEPRRQEVAQRLSFDWSESVTLGRAIADWLALRKGEYLGILEADEEAERVAREATDDLPTRTVEILVREDGPVCRNLERRIVWGRYKIRH